MALAVPVRALRHRLSAASEAPSWIHYLPDQLSYLTEGRHGGGSDRGVFAALAAAAGPRGAAADAPRARTWAPSGKYRRRRTCGPLG
eukprot:CAMPEP_0195062986 /NCGR_PEP_ID=MMETSP0448-20130528/9467_1 /TAXON_ID=66468 /ORGANISM="Heterocapsa triquestra, Strain CCMP 448" /LENGTH=86 /DNA_ID=CAMNT_0040093775 /DNA_START=1 /DNA_END=258 /DNA_ORIENTATION=-